MADNDDDDEVVDAEDDDNGEPAEDDGLLEAALAFCGDESLEDNGGCIRL